MKKDKLFTVNKWNKPMFASNKNILKYGSPLGGLSPQQMADLREFNLSANMTPTLTTSSLGMGTLAPKGGLGSLSETDPSKFFGTDAGASTTKGGLLNNGALKEVGTGLAAAGIGMLGNAAGNAIAGGKTSKAGNMIGSVGSAVLGMAGTAIGGPLGGAIGSALGSTLGGLTNAAFGSELNEQKISEVESNNAQREAENNALYGVNSTDDLINSVSNMTNAMAFNQGDIGDDGWFSSDAEDKYDELKAQQEQIDKMRGVAIGTATGKVNRNQYINSMKNNLTAFGGKLFADGGDIEPGNTDADTDSAGEAPEVEANPGGYADPAYHEWWLRNRQQQLQENIDAAGYHPYPQSAERETDRQLANVAATKEGYFNQKTAPYNYDEYGNANVDARYVPGSNPEIEYEENYTKKWGARPDETVHERTHALNRNLPYGYSPQEEKVQAILREGLKDNTISHRSEYNLRPHEVYGYLMQQRYNLGLKPDYVVTPEDINKWKHDSKVDWYFNHLDDDTVLRLFNEVAYEPVERQDDVNYAANGGKINSFDNGGLKYNFIQDFGKDPIGAVVRYNQGLEDLAAKEALLRRSEEQSFQNELLQQQMEDLRLTPPNFSININQDWGLNGIPQAPKIEVVPIVPEATPKTIKRNKENIGLHSFSSKAAPKDSWGYIEGELKKSGKFNDTQIEGIKYNLQRESSIDPTIIGDSGAAFGLGQWHGSRKPKDKSLKGQTKHLIDTISNYDGEEHWINKKDYDGFMNARTPEEAHYYLAKGYERPKASIVAKVKRDSDMSLLNLRAFGGELGTNGTDFTNGLLYIDEGGSHESNPLEGVPMGLDPEGIPNLVEEGETVYNDYVFSDRMKVPDFMLKDLGLPKNKKGISFAGASKKLAQESEKRPNDPISKEGLQASLSRLAEIQETERMRKQAKEFVENNGYACGGKINNKYDGTNPRGQRVRIGATPPPIGFTMPVISDPTTAARIAALPSKGNKKAPNNSNRDSDRNFGKRANAPQSSNTGQLDMLEARVDSPIEDKEPTATEVITGTEQGVIGGGTVDKNLDINFGMDSKYNNYYRGLENNPKTYPTWMRYAPAAGAGIMSLTDALGITNNPDYTYADKLEGYARQAGYTPNISYKPIGNYLRYNPMDIWFEQNRMDANARATDRAIMNNAAPIGTKMAGLLASGYNNQIANGQLYRNALEYNDAKRKDVAGFNRTTDMFNSQMGLEAAMANARYQQAARQMGLSGLAQAAAMRNDIDARVGAARSANLTNFLTSLGNIGRENFALNQLNWDKSRHYTTDASGRSGYKKKASCGGKLNRK